MVKSVNSLPCHFDCREKSAEGNHNFSHPFERFILILLAYQAVKLREKPSADFSPEAGFEMTSESRYVSSTVSFVRVSLKSTNALTLITNEW